MSNLTTRPDGDPGKPGRTGEGPIDPPSPRAPTSLPSVRPLDFETLAASAAPDATDYWSTVAREAIRLDPILKMKGLYSQTVAHAESLRRGEPWLYAGGFGLHATDTIRTLRRNRDVLATAASAADAALSQITAELGALEQAMSDKRNDEQGHPLTTDGSTHPLVEGGYDPDADGQLKAEESPSAGLKAGHTTKAQAEALARSDTAPGSHTGGPDRPGTTPTPPMETPKAGSPGISTPTTVVQQAPTPSDVKAATSDNPLAKPPAEKK